MNCTDDGYHETARIESVYSQRGYDTDPHYSDTNPVYLQRVQSMERVMLLCLRKAELVSRMSDLRVLDFGCGNGKWFGRWMAWGAKASNLVGIDIRRSAVELAKRNFPCCSFDTMEPGHVPFPDATFDVVLQNVVFSSITDLRLRRLSAAEMIRVTKPGGMILWCDFIFDNPTNPNVRAVTRREVRKLFSGINEIVAKKIVLAPPIARKSVPLSWLCSEALEMCLPFLCTHLFVGFGIPYCRLATSGR